MRNQEGRKGITLIALVITIIVLLILAGVTLIFVSNQKDSVIGKSQDATNQYEKEEATEKINLKITNSQMNGYIKSQRMPTLQEIADDFCEDDEIQYVELQSQRIASIEKINVGTNKSIFTKLKEYPYEFEINSSLQLASIDGVKISNNDTITISREEYEELKNKVENIGQVYSKTNITTLNVTNNIVEQKNVSWTIPKGTWIVDFAVNTVYRRKWMFCSYFKR